MKLLTLLLFPCFICAQTVKDTLSIVAITFQKQDGTLFTPENLWRINFKDSTTLVVRHKDSTRDVYFYKDAQVLKDTTVYRFIPLYLPQQLQEYLTDTTLQKKVKFIITYR